MLNLYCIPGMGVDGRLFKNIKPENCAIHHIKWGTPLKNESLRDYAMRLAEQIDQSEPFALLGVSFGGMCATEIAKELKPVKTFVISSCKTSNELPFKIVFFRSFRIYRHLQDSHFIKGAMLVRKQFGVKTKEQTEKFKEMLIASPENYFRGAIHCIINWSNEQIPKGVVHIHGTADKVLPIRKIKCDHVIRDGSHFMIVDKAKEINEIIENALSGIKKEIEL